MRGARQKTVARFLEENGDLRTQPFVATQFLLLSARPGSGGPPYGVEETFPLEAPALEAATTHLKEQEPWRRS